MIEQHDFLLQKTIRGRTASDRSGADIAAIGARAV
jgi:hypothetical protein